jgi:hypothetical protein
MKKILSFSMLVLFLMVLIATLALPFRLCKHSIAEQCIKNGTFTHNDVTYVCFVPHPDNFKKL